MEGRLGSKGDPGKLHLAGRGGRWMTPEVAGPCLRGRWEHRTDAPPTRVAPQSRPLCGDHILPPARRQREQLEGKTCLEKLRAQEAAWGLQC